MTKTEIFSDAWARAWGERLRASDEYLTATWTLEQVLPGAET